jgi:hypothetical protein
MEITDDVMMHDFATRESVACPRDSLGLAFRRIDPFLLSPKPRDLGGVRLQGTASTEKTF